MMRAQRTNEDTERVDLLGLRRIMLELMEPRTCRYGDGEEELRHPEEWKEDEGSGIIDFLRATTTCSLEKLQKVSLPMFVIAKSHKSSICFFHQTTRSGPI